MALTMTDLDVSWVAAVEAFVDESPWLSRKHLPQLKALYSIALELDQPGSKKQAALISQFTLTQRTLLGKAPETGDGEGARLPGLDDWEPEAVRDDYGSRV